LRGATRDDGTPFIDEGSDVLLSEDTPRDPDLVAAAVDLVVDYVTAKDSQRNFRDFVSQTSQAIGRDTTLELDAYLREAWDLVRKRFGEASGMNESRPIAEVMDADADTGEVDEGTDTEADEDTETESALDTSTPQGQLADWVSQRLASDQPIRREDFFAAADHAFGGSRAEGKYGDSAAYDALELGVNHYIAGRQDWSPAADPVRAKEIIGEIEALQQRLPQHKARTGEKDTLQQFSTPPAYGWLANWAANIGQGDVMLEPSGGIGGLAVHAHNAGATVYANEIDEARAPPSSNGSESVAARRVCSASAKFAAVRQSPPKTAFSTPIRRCGI
jgi:hypothetical protein